MRRDVLARRGPVQTRPVAAAAEEKVDLIYTYVFAPGDEQLSPTSSGRMRMQEGGRGLSSYSRGARCCWSASVPRVADSTGSLSIRGSLPACSDEHNDFTAIAASDTLTIDLSLYLRAILLGPSTTSQTQ